MYTSNGLSQAYGFTETPEDRSGEAEVEAYVDFIMHSIPVSDRTMDEIRHETSQDREQQLLTETIVSPSVQQRYFSIGISDMNWV